MNQINKSKHSTFPLGVFPPSPPPPHCRGDDSNGKQDNIDQCHDIMVWTRGCFMLALMVINKTIAIVLPGTEKKLTSKVRVKMLLFKEKLQS